MLMQQLEQRKLTEQAKVANELQNLIFNRDVLGIKGLDDEIIGLEKRMGIIDEVAETVGEGFDEFAENVANNSSGIVKLDENIVRHEKTLENLQNRLSGLKEGTELKLKISIRGENKEDINTVGRVAWIDLKRDICGIEFISVLYEDRLKIRNYIRDEYFKSYKK